MLNTELKACLSALKTTMPKRGGIPSIQKVAKRGNALITTDLETYSELAIGLKLEDGLYEPYTLDLIAMGNQEATPSVEWALNDYPELDIKGWREWHTLTNADIDHIIEAGDCVSKDDTRPVLCVVALTDGLIAGTDGYIMVAHPQSEGLNFADTTVYLNKTIVATLKKLRKFGNWRIRVSEDGYNVCLTNDTFVLISKNEYGTYPDITKLLDNGREFTHRIDLDLTTILVMADKDRDNLDIDPTGNVALAGQPTGVVAKIAENPETCPLTNGRKVIMPMRAEAGHIALSVKLLKRLTKAKSITLLTNADRFGMIEVR